MDPNEQVGDSPIIDQMVEKLQELIRYIGGEHFTLCCDDWRAKPLVNLVLESNGFSFEVSGEATVKVDFSRGCVFATVRGMGFRRFSSGGMISPIHDDKPQKAFDEVVEYLLLA